MTGFDWSKSFNAALSRGHEHSSAAFIADRAEQHAKQMTERKLQAMADQPEHIMQFFAYAHLPEHLQAVSRPFGEMAERIVADIPRNPERTVALRKLLEAKDATVRAFLAKP